MCDECGSIGEQLDMIMSDLNDAQKIIGELILALEGVLSGQLGGNVDHEAERFTAARRCLAKAKEELGYA